MRKGKWKGMDIIPCYFTLDELKAIKGWMKDAENNVNGAVWGEYCNLNLFDQVMENINGKIKHEKELIDEHRRQSL